MRKEVEEFLSKVGSETWVTSDQHWAHKNIRKYQDRPDNHFDLMEEKWHELVKEDDVILCLGDMVCFPGDTFVWWIQNLPGKKYILLGNHDEKEYSNYQNVGFTVLGRKPFWWNEICFSHEPVTKHFVDKMYPGLDEKWDMNIHGHIHGNGYHGDLPRLNYVNVCVEVTDYAPVRLGDVLAGTAGRRRQDERRVGTYD